MESSVPTLLNLPRDLSARELVKARGLGYTLKRMPVYRKPHTNAKTKVAKFHYQTKPASPPEQFFVPVAADPRLQALPLSSPATPQEWVGPVVEVHEIIRVANEACRLMREHPPAPKTYRERCEAKMRSLPPNLSVHQVAKELNLRYATASQWCRKFNYHPIRGTHRLCLRKLKSMGKLPPGLILKEIAKLLRVSYATARDLASNTGYAYRRNKGSHQKVSDQKWQEVDWSKPACMLAKELGVTRQLVHLKRKRLGIASLPRPSREAHRWQFADLPPGLSIPEVAALLHMPRNTVNHYCKVFGYKPRTKLDELYALRKAQFRKLKPGLSARQIGDKLMLTTVVAYRWAHRLGYALSRTCARAADGRAIFDAMQEKFRSLPPGLTLGQLMKCLERKRQATTEWCRCFGYQYGRSKK